MFILLKKYIKASLVFLLVIGQGIYLYASKLQSPCNEKPVKIDLLSHKESNIYILSKPAFSFTQDTVFTGQSEIDQKKAAVEDSFKIPDNLAHTPINFQINSAINYVVFKNFVRNDSKRIFYEAWLKKKELQKLTLELDSLRKLYTNVPSEQKESISNQILQSEKKSIALNEEIPSMFEKARNEEDQYWQNASPDEIAKFQEKIKTYKDSIMQLAEKKSLQTAIRQDEVHDTITFYSALPPVVEKKAIEPDITTGIIYKIQIGAYKGKMPESANKLIKKLSIIRKVDNYIDAKGVKIYTTGNLRLYKEAETLQNQVKQEGVKNAVITAYKNGEKISVNEARKLNNEL